MNNEQNMVLDFHRKYGCYIAEHPAIPSDSILMKRIRLITSEVTEFIEAASIGDLVGMIDALADIKYVVDGTGVVLGVDLEPCFAEVHRSNMTKDGGPDSGGKITKGPSYEPPDLISIINKQKNELQT